MGLFSKKKAEPVEQKPKITSKKKYFDVVGSKYEQNGEMTGQEIMDIIPKRIIKSAGEKLYGGYTKKEMKECYMDEVSIYQDFEFDCVVKETDYEGEMGIKVFLQDNEDSEFGIGWILKNDLEEFRRCYFENDGWIDLTIDGGHIKDICGEEYDKLYSPYITVHWWEEI